MVKKRPISGSTANRAEKCVLRRIKTHVLLLLFALATPLRGAEPMADRFVWVCGWNLEQEGDVPEVVRVLDAAGQHGCNGAVLSAGLDSLSQKSPDFFRRLELVKKACERNHLE